MSPVVPLVRQVPTLTEVLEEAALNMPPEARSEAGQSQAADPNMGLKTGACTDEQFRQAILALVDTAIEEFRAELVLRLDGLLGRASETRPERGAEEA